MFIKMAMENMKTIKIIMIISFAIALPAHSLSGINKSLTLFAGVPEIKISEGGVDRNSEVLYRERAANLICIISKIGEKYFWASRENIEMNRSTSGAFVTFIAKNGSGYVRFILPDSKNAASLMGNTETEFDYVEHLLIGLKSVSYYGRAKK
jgi:hypothetical protein